MNILIIDRVHKVLLDSLNDLDVNVDYRPSISRKELMDCLENYSILVVRNKTTIDKVLIDKANNLELIIRAGSGLDEVDIKYAKLKNIKVLRTPKGNSNAVGEHTLGLLLSLTNRIDSSFQRIKQGFWLRYEHTGTEILGKTVGIYGMGVMGKCFAKKIASLGCNVIGYDKYKKNYSSDFIQEVDLDVFFEKTEILSIHVNLTEETRHLFSTSYLNNFQRLKFIINTSRGEVMPFETLLEIADDIRYDGIAIDVLENEIFFTYTKKELDYLRKLTQYPHLIITPHIGGWSKESGKKIAQEVFKKIKKHIQRKRKGKNLPFSFL